MVIFRRLRFRFWLCKLVWVGFVLILPYFFRAVVCTFPHYLGLILSVVHFVSLCSDMLG